MNRWLLHHKDIGVLLLRIFIGWRLVYGVLDNIMHRSHMEKFTLFLDHFHFPFPAVAAYVSVYLQFFAGLMIVAGWKIRVAALAMILNFLIAIIVVHRNDSIEVMTPPLAILFCNLLFLFQGAGKYSFDSKLLHHENKN